ncbi:hypothetical protein VPH35_068327 [Triticum aestivum]|uniref:Thiol methyltransferase 2 n=3 Tax=Triticum TaxID=4564 RepID=A0A9R0SKI4_TRITD|nr:unnamed protein product [Triticum turgidum subsp. durum]
MASTAVADANAGGFGVGQVLDGSNPAIVRLRQLVDGPQSSEGWRRCWEQGVTPWDLGQPTPVVVKLVQSGTLPAGGATVLVPGCGGGYDAVALSGGRRSVVGLDVCDAVIQKASQRSSSSPDVAFITADFFTWAPPDDRHCNDHAWMHFSLKTKTRGHRTTRQCSTTRRCSNPWVSSSNPSYYNSISTRGYSGEAWHDMQNSISMHTTLSIIIIIYKTNVWLSC